MNVSLSLRILAGSEGSEEWEDCEEEEEDDETYYKMVFVVNTELSMGVGKVAAQVSEEEKNM